jgi:hypothetical protein
MTAITKQQIKLIKLAQSQLGIDTETKIEHYAQFNATSCKQLEYKEAQELIEFYVKKGFKIKSNEKGKSKYEELKKRSDEFATPKQLRMLEALWRTKADKPTDENLQKFIKNQVGISSITFLLKSHVRKLVTIIKKFKRD